MLLICSTLQIKVPIKERIYAFWDGWDQLEPNNKKFPYCSVLLSFYLRNISRNISRNSTVWFYNI